MQNKDNLPNFLYQNSHICDQIIENNPQLVRCELATYFLAKDKVMRTAQALSQNTHLKEITIYSYSDNDLEQLLAFAKALQVNKTLTRFDYMGSHEPTDILEFINRMHTNTTLTYLHLSQPFGIADEEVLQRIYNLETRNRHQVFIDKPLSTRLSELSNTKITGKMYKSDCYPIDTYKNDDKSLKWKQQRAKTNEAYEKSERNSFSPFSIWVTKNAKDARRQSSLLFNYKNCYLTESNGKVIIINPTLAAKVNADLYKNFDEEKQNKKMQDTIRQNKQRENTFNLAEQMKFYAAGIEIDDAFAVQLAHFFKSEHTFQEINLGGNKITDFGASKLIEALNESDQPIHLILTANHIEDTEKLKQTISNPNLTINVTNQKIKSQTNADENNQYNSSIKF